MESLKNKFTSINQTTKKISIKKKGEILGMDVEVGDEKKTNFYPRAKVKLWDNEVNFSIGPKMGDDEVNNLTVEESANMISFKKAGVKHRFYTKEKFFNKQRTELDNLFQPIAESEGGMFEFDTILDTQPASNVIEYTITTKGLDFHFQPKLPETERLDKKVGRAINVEGSYAVYHAGRNNRHASSEDAKKYKTGKAFHIYRPYVEDANGDFIWADLDIDVQAETLKITIDEKWLKKAAYPIVIDPTIGYTTVGASSIVIADSNNDAGIFNVITGEEGTLDSVHFYASESGNLGSLYISLYEFDSGDETNQAQVDCGVVSVTSSTPAWYSITSASEILEAAKDYLVGCGGGLAQGSKSSTLDGYYDTLTEDLYYTNTGNSGGYQCNTDPITIHATPHFTDRRISTYITYTASYNPAFAHRRLLLML